MIKRESEKILLELYESFPVITITGPRQSGKTTLVKFSFPRKPYVSLENPATREFASEDPVGFLSQYPDGAILDEIQRVPLLLSYIQTIVDDINKELGTNIKIETQKSLPDGDDCCLRRIWVE